MNASTLSNDELNQQIAEAVGGRVVRDMWFPELNRAGTAAGMWSRPVPNFATSLDALSEPEQRLRDAGWVLEVRVEQPGADAHWMNIGGLECIGMAPTEARARAEAVLVALKALAEVKP